MFTILATPMIEAIHFLHQFTNNYALSVIVITIIIRLLLLPLFMKASNTQSQSKLMMDEVKPKMDELSEKLKAIKDDQQKLAIQLEMQQLSLAPMKSMLLGCFPIIIQFPVLIAIFYAIKYDAAIASESFLWMNLGTTSITMACIAAFVYLLQSLFAMKKEQQRTVKLMAFINPIVIFIFSMINPSIMAIYWATSAVMLIGQQQFIAYYNRSNK